MRNGLLFLPLSFAVACDTPAVDQDRRETAQNPTEVRCDLLIENVGIVDIVGERIAGHKDVCISGAEIEALLDTASGPVVKAAQRIPGSGRYLIPGLHDMHVHFRGGRQSVAENRDLLTLYFVHGVTGVYDLGSDIPAHLIQWRDDIRAGALAGPDLYLTGPKVDGPDAPFAGSIEIESRNDAERAVERLISEGADGVKIMGATLSTDAFWYALEAARNRNLQALAHLPPTISAIEAAERGLDAIAHLAAFVDDGAIAADRIRARRLDGELSFVETMSAFDMAFDESRMREMIERLSHTDTALISTYYGRWLMANALSNDVVDWEREHYRYVGPITRNSIERGFVDDGSFARETQDAWQNRRDHIDWILQELAKTDVTLLVGSDSGPRNSVPGRVTHREMILLVEAGLSPGYVLRAATYNPAIFLGHGEKAGLVAPGYIANLVLLAANPLDDIANVSRIAGVIKSGRFYSRAQLDEMLSLLERKYGN